MKFFPQYITPTIFLFLGGCHTVGAAWGRTATTTTSTLIPHHRNVATTTTAALSIRGGSSALLNPENINQATVVSTAYLAVWQAFDPESFWESLTDMKVERGSLGSFLTRWAGWAQCGIPLFYFLNNKFSQVVSADAIIIVLLSTLPAYAYFTYSMLRGILRRWYTPSAVVIAYLYWTALYAGALWMDTSKNNNAMIPFTVSLVGVLGLFGWLFPDVAADDVGIGASLSPTDTVVWKWSSATMWMALAFVKLLSFSTSEEMRMRNVLAMGLVVLLEAVALRSPLLKEANVSLEKVYGIGLLNVILVALLSFLPR